MVKKDVPILVSKDNSKLNLIVMGVSGKGMCFNNKLVLMKNEDREKGELRINERFI